MTTTRIPNPSAPSAWSQCMTWDKISNRLKKKIKNNGVNWCYSMKTVEGNPSHSTHAAAPALDIVLRPSQLPNKINLLG